MAEYYVDPTATGADSGATKTDAWTSLQRAIDGTGGTQPVAGDTVLLKANGSTADETLTVKIDVGGASGTTADGCVHYVGVNSSWVDEDTRYYIDGNGAAVNCLDFNAAVSYNVFKNIRCSNATSHGVNFNFIGPSVIIFDNCCFDLNGGMGIWCDRNNSGLYWRCTAYSNTSSGFSNEASSRLFFCSSHDNGGNGFYSDSTLLYYGCLAYDNNSNGFGNIQNSTAVLCCVADGNATGVYISVDRGLVLFSRITNQSVSGNKGIDASLEFTFTGYNYFENNDGANIQNTIGAYIFGANTEDQANTNQGYTSITDGSEDFNLRSDASLRRTAVTVPII